MDRLQVNVRLTAEILEAIDQRRMAMQPTLRRIPNRSEVIREVLESALLGAKPQEAFSKKLTEEVA